MNVKSVIGKGVSFISKHDTQILTGVSIISTIASVYFTYKNTPKFKKVLEELGEDATLTEKAKKLVPVAAPTIISATVSVASTLAMNKVASDKIDKLASICSVHQITNTIHEEYEKKVKEIVGEEKAEEIKTEAQKSVAEEKYKAINMGDDEYSPIETGHGRDLFYLAWTDQWFRASIEFVKESFNNLEYQLMNDMQISVDEILAELCLPSANAYEGQVYNINNGRIGAKYFPRITDSDRVYTLITMNEPYDKFIGERSMSGHLSRY